MTAAPLTMGEKVVCTPIAELGDWTINPPPDRGVVAVGMAELGPPNAGTGGNCTRNSGDRTLVDSWGNAFGLIVPGDNTGASGIGVSLGVFALGDADAAPFSASPLNEGDGKARGADGLPKSMELGTVSGPEDLRLTVWSCPSRQR
jgi:hypothetical protein